jgi:hypothetical protein
MIALDAVRPLSQIPTKPLKMQNGGEAEKRLAEGPPEDINMLPRFEGFEAGPNQFELPDERMYLNRKQRDTFPMPEVEGPISSEPNRVDIPGADGMMEGTQLQEKLFTTPTIDPREVYPRDPDPFIQGFFDPMPQSTGGIPNLLQANMLKPLGILSINKTYNI